MAPEARARGVAIACRSDAALLSGHSFGVQTLLRNLLNNALKYYTPAGASSCRCTRSGPTCA